MILIQNENVETFEFTTVLKGFLYAVVANIFLILLFSLFFQFTPLSEKYLMIISLLILFTSVFIGGFFASKLAGAKGLFHGLGVATIFFILHLILSLTFGSQNALISDSIIKIIAIMIGGAIGGILGIGFNDK